MRYLQLSGQASRFLTRTGRSASGAAVQQEPPGRGPVDPSLHVHQIYENVRQRNDFKARQARERMAITLGMLHETHKVSMFKKLSTPRQAAMHVSYIQAQQGVIAVHNPKIQITDDSTPDKFTGIQLLSMHEAMESEGNLTLLHYQTRPHLLPDALSGIFEELMGEVNQAFWRSCQIVLFRALKAAMPNGLTVKPHRRPDFSFRNSTAFVYDVTISGDTDIFQGQNQLTERELILLNKYARKIIKQKEDFLPVRLSSLSDIDAISAVFDTDTLYAEDAALNLVKNGDHIEMFPISEPCVPHTGHMANFSVTRMTKISTCDKTGDVLARIQGVAIPESTNPEIFRIMERKAREFVPTDLTESIHEVGDNVDLGPLYSALEKQTKYFNKDHYQIMDRYLQPNRQLTESDPPSPEISFELNSMRYNQGANPENMLPATAIHKMGLSRRMRSNKKSEVVQKYNEYQQAYDLMYMLGGPITKIGARESKHRRILLHTKNMGGAPQGKF